MVRVGVQVPPELHLGHVHVRSAQPRSRRSELGGWAGVGGCWARGAASANGKGAFEKGASAVGVVLLEKFLHLCDERFGLLGVAGLDKSIGADELKPCLAGVGGVTVHA